MLNVRRFLQLAIVEDSCDLRRENNPVVSHHYPRQEFNRDEHVRS